MCSTRVDRNSLMNFVPIWNCIPILSPLVLLFTFCFFSLLHKKRVKEGVKHSCTHPAACFLLPSAPISGSLVSLTSLKVSFIIFCISCQSLPILGLCYPDSLLANSLYLLVFCFTYVPLFFYLIFLFLYLFVFARSFIVSFFQCFRAS